MTLKSRSLIIVLAVLLLAFGLRLYQIQSQSVWWDEGISLHLATSNIGDLLNDRLNNIHPPFYFLGLKGWLLAGGVNVFNARYLSLLAGWFQVAVVIALARRWFNLGTGLLAGFLAAISAVSIIYSQEIRVYSFLPLLYLGLLGVTRELTRKENMNRGGSPILWITLGLGIWLGLHLHYITFFIVLYVSLWAFIIYIRNKQWLCFKRWLIVQFLVLLASLPWFIPLIENLSKVNAEANAGTYFTEAVPIKFLIAQIWAFHLSGLAGFLSRDGAWTAALTSAACLLLLFLIRLVQKNTRMEAITLFLQWFIPLSSALIVWAVRSFSHPRYVVIFVPGLILFSAYLILPPHRLDSKLWAGVIWVYSIMVFLSILVISLWGLRLYYFDPNVGKDDMRGVARYLEGAAHEGDLILVPDTDWSLNFEYKGSASIAMPHFDELDGGWSNLTELTKNKNHVFVVEYLEGSRDWQNKLPFALAVAGTEVEEERFEGIEVREYKLNMPISHPVMQEKDINFSPLLLKSAWIEQDTLDGNKLAVALTWEINDKIEDEAHVSLRMYDRDGWLVSSDDTLLRDSVGRPTNYWPLGETVTTYHLIPIPPALPPLAYAVSLQVYLQNEDEIKPLDQIDESGIRIKQEASIGFAHIANRPTIEMSVVRDLPLTFLLSPIELEPGLKLLATNIDPETVYEPGDKVTVYLLWQAGENIPENWQPNLMLFQGNTVLAEQNESTLFNHFPTKFWEEGEVVYERRGIMIPSDASGDMVVKIRSENEEFPIGQVFVQAGDHLFDLPENMVPIDGQFGDVGRLRGFVIEKDNMTQDEPLPLKLIWQSTTDGTAVDYVVFAHLLADDGQLIGQHDSPPANGSRHTTGWIENEIILDQHAIGLNEVYQGIAAIEIGIYDPQSGERLLLANGADHLILPVKIDVLP